MKRKTPSLPNKKQQEREAAESYKKLLEKWDKVPKFARTAAKPQTDKLELKLSAPPGREAARKIASFSTPGESTALKKTMQYTGTEMIGIGQMHKSNSVPIFKKEDAADLSKMRRN